ncbi:hypothetical protein RA210_U10359 [Rubrivivax sp. A210]|nr:hypothetical protein RA210_U10359 [Rubrivivax sp. A210]
MPLRMSEGLAVNAFPVLEAPRHYKCRVLQIEPWRDCSQLLFGKSQELLCCNYVALLCEDFVFFEDQIIVRCIEKVRKVACRSIGVRNILVEHHANIIFRTRRRQRELLSVLIYAKTGSTVVSMS